MAYDVIHKNSTVAGTPPAAGEVEIGEIAINAADADFYTKDTSGAINVFSNNQTIATKAAFAQADTDATQRTIAGKLQDVVSVLDFIPVSEHSAIRSGTSSYNAKESIQSAIDYALSLQGGTLYFPAGTYLVDDTLRFGVWSIDASTGNVQGFARAKTGIKVVGESRGGASATLIKWIGSVQAGDNAVTQSDSVGTYTFITNDKPIIGILAGYQLFFEGISLDGDNKAHTGIEFDGNFSNVSFQDARIKNCLKVGLRITKGIRHDSYGQYYGYADSPYYKANVYNAPSFGGFQSDTFSVKNVHFSNCGTGISCESAQALAVTYDNIWVSGSYDYGFINVGGRLNMRAVGVGGNNTYGIWHVANSSTIEVQEFHDEATTTASFNSSTVAGTNTRVHFHNGDLNNIRLAAGDGTVILENVFWNGTLSRIADNSSTQKTIIDIRNSRLANASSNIVNLGTVSNKENVLFNAHGNTLTGGGGITTDWGKFVGKISALSPSPTYTVFESLPSKSTWIVEKTNGRISSDGYAMQFSGLKTSIADETTTTLCSFTPGTSHFYKITMNVLLQTGPSVNVAVASDTITFSLGKSNSGTLLVSSVEVINSHTLPFGYVSISATYSLNISGSSVELQVNQNNESFDSNVAATYSGEIIGGFSGGSISVALFTPN